MKFNGYILAIKKSPKINHLECTEFHVTVGIGYCEYLPRDMAKTVAISDICHMVMVFILSENQIKAGK